MSKKIQRMLENVQLNEQQEASVLKAVELTQKDLAAERIATIEEMFVGSVVNTYTLDLKGLYDQIRALYAVGKFSLVVRLADVLLDYLPNIEK